MHPRTVPILLAVGSLSPPPDDLTEVPCLRCVVTLDWHQPDPGNPGRLLGVCGRCGRWHLVDRMPDEGEAVLVLLPEALDLRAALD